MLEAAKEIARSDGLGALSFGRVARQLGTNDRTVVYYFPSKAELIGAVLVALGDDLQELLAEAFGEKPLPPSDLGRRAWQVLARDETQPIFALFFEILGQAAVGTAPFVDLAPCSSTTGCGGSNHGSRSRIPENATPQHWHCWRRSTGCSCCEPLPARTPPKMRQGCSVSADGVRTDLAIGPNPPPQMGFTPDHWRNSRYRG